MKRYFLFLIFISLLFSLPYTAYSLPNKVITLQEKYENPDFSNMFVGSFGNDEYLGIKCEFWSKKKRNVGSYKFYIVDLKKREKIYEKLYKTNSYPPLNLNRFRKIYEKYFIYTVYNDKHPEIEIHRIDLTTKKEIIHYLSGDNTSNTFKDGVLNGKRGLFVVGNNQLLYFYSYLKDELTEFKLHELSMDDLLLFQNIGISYDKKDYGKIYWINIKTGKKNLLGNTNTIYIPKCYTFDQKTPILPTISKENGKWALKVYDENMNTIKKQPFSTLGISTNSKIHKFQEVAYSQKSSIFKIEFLNKKIVYIFFDSKGNIKHLLFLPKSYGEGVIKLTNGNILLFVKNSNGWHIVKEGKLFPIDTRKINPDIGTGDGESFIFGKFNNFFKYSLKKNKIVGTYLFPKSKTTLLGRIYNGNVYVITFNGYTGYMDIESFPFSSVGWFPLRIEFSPHAEKPNELYDNTDTKVIIENPYDYNIRDIGDLKMKVDRGQIRWKDGKGWIWHTPSIRKQKEDAKLTVTIASISKEFPVKIVKQSEKIKLILNRDNFPRGTLIFSVKGEVINTTNIELKNIKWNIKTMGLKDIRKSLTNYIPKKGSTFIHIYGFTSPRNTKIKWNGYTIKRKVTVMLTHRWGSITKSLREDLKIEPKYGFNIKVEDDSGNELPLEEKDLKLVRVFTKSKKDITDNLQIKLLNHYRVSIRGISPGFPGKPLNLIVKWGGYEKKIALSFDVSSDSYVYNTPTITFKGTKTKLYVDVRAEGKPLNSFYITIENGKKVYNAKTSIEDIEPGRWKIRVSSRGYFPYEKEIVVKKATINKVTVDLKKFVGLIFKIDSYYKNAFKDVKKAKVKAHPGLKKVTDYIYILPKNHDKIYFGTVYKVGRPDKITASVFGEDTYSVYAEVDTIDDQFIFSDGCVQEKPIKNYTIDKFYNDLKEKRGYKITKPTMLKITLRAEADTTKEERFIIWIFPSKWLGYEKQAIEGVILYSFKDNMDLFSYPEEAKSYIENKAAEQLTISALSNIVWYGMSSLDFLKGALGIPDFGIFDIGQTAIQEYVDYKLQAKVTEYLQTDPELKSKINDISPVYRSMLLTGITGEVCSAISSIVAAGNWAMGMSSVIEEGVEKVVAGAILEAIWEKDNHFRCMVNTLTSAKDEVQDIINAVENNHPIIVKSKIKKLSKCFVSLNTNNKGGCDSYCNKHPLSWVFLSELVRIDEWKGGNTWPSFAEELLRGFTNEQKYGGSKIAMKIYEPIIKTFIYIASPIIDACIIEGK